MSDFKTEQEQFWAGDFGTEYSSRCVGAGWIATNTALFAKILARTNGVRSVIEFGANIGLNLRALHTLLPEAALAAVEINETAAATLREVPATTVHVGSMLGFSAPRTYDLAFVKGVLIHVNPDSLGDAYDALYRASARYVCVAEYYSPSPQAIRYRGHDNRLFKRDFAGELLDRFKDLRLVDYGFQYHRDPNFPQDDLTWFLLEKKA